MNQEMITDRERQGEILKQLREEYPLPSKAERKKAYYEKNKDKLGIGADKKTKMRRAWNRAR